ncbi:MAG: YceD family protein [Corynebacterium sp.]|nr:YceD family protein [Corynebacterium sp.]
METNPFIFDIARLAKAPLTITHTGPAPVRIGAEMMALPAEAPLTVDATFYPLGEGVQVEVRVSGTAQATCVRCLTEHAIPTEITATGLYALSEDFISGDDAGADASWGDASASGGGDVAEDVPLVTDDLVDVTQLVIDEAGTQFPFNPTCASLTGSECLSGEEAEVPAPDGVSGEQTDPRWDALKEWASNE